MDLYANHISNLKEAFEKVVVNLEVLTHHVNVDLKELPVWSQNIDKDGFGCNRTSLISAISKLNYDFSHSPQETVSFAGAIASTQATKEIIEQINNAKDLFKAALSQYRESPLYDERTKSGKALLAKAGYKGVSIKQVCRHIHFVDFHPRRIAWAEAKYYSNKTISQSDAYNLLMNAGKGEHIDVQLDRLKKDLSSANEKLVIQIAIKPSLLVNFSTFKDKSGRSQTFRLKTSLPVFFKYDANLKLPIVVFSKTFERKQRCDKKLEDNVFLPSIHAYRYKIL